MIFAQSKIRDSSESDFVDIQSDEIFVFFCLVPLRGANIGVNDSWIQNGVTVAGGNGRGTKFNQLHDPYGLYVDDNQTIYIADFQNDRIVEWKSNATSGQVVAGGNGKEYDQLNGPTDVIVDKETNSLIICDSRNEQVIRRPRRDGTNGETIIIDIHCMDLTMDDNGFLYVPDHDKKEMRRWSVGKTYVKVALDVNGDDLRINRVEYPSNVFADRYRSSHASNMFSRRGERYIGRVKEAFSFVGTRHDYGQRLGSLTQPHGVVVDQLGTLYVADCVNNCIMRWPKSATRGNVIVGGNGDGAQPNQLSCPKGLAFDRQGNLFVADTRNHRVQRFNIKRSS
jgi:sugar lactone lactonase YvrE